MQLFLARFLRFQLDKFTTPEFFCWPGIWMAGDRAGPCSLERAAELFETHRALFMDQEDGDIYPRIFPGKPEAAVQSTFDLFYQWNAIYELTRQWIYVDGDFDFDFFWLTSKYSRSEIKEWAATGFEHVFGVRPESFRILRLESRDS